MNLLKVLILFLSLLINTLGHLIQSIFSNLIITIPTFIIIYLNFGLNESILIIVPLAFLLYLLSEWGFYLESVRSTFDYIYYALILTPICKPFIRNGETIRASLKIRVKNEYYRVVRFAKIEFMNMKFSKKLRQLDKPLGYLVIDSKNEIISDKAKLREILTVYNIWHHFYINLLFKDIKVNYYFLKNGVFFNKLVVDGIKDRQNNNYQEILEKKGKEYTDILTQLDNQVLQQSPFLIAKIKAQMKLIKLLYIIWEYPSDSLYVEMERLFQEIRINASKENDIWDIRQNYWHKLKEYGDERVSKIKPDLSITKKTIILTLIEISLTKQFPFLGVALDKLYELTKYPIKYLLYFYNKKIIYHQFGINAIRKNIEMNQKLEEVSNTISSIKNQPTIQLIRNKLE